MPARPSQTSYVVSLSKEAMYVTHAGTDVMFEHFSAPGKCMYVHRHDVTRPGKPNYIPFKGHSISHSKVI